VNYTEALSWIYGTQHHGIKPGLAAIRRLMGELGFEGKAQRFIHVAGTNGKGSVCAMIDAVCRAEGLHTGLYTSPHLVTYRERIRLDGAMISEEQTACGLTKIARLVAGWEPHPTFFEITTALALDFFERQQAEIVVLETGMGGRLDATNVLDPIVSVITAIDLDHQAWLGSTLGEIAHEKAGIIKPGVPVVSSPQKAEAAGVLVKTAAEKNAPLEFVTEPLVKFPVGLAGSHQKLNAALAIAALSTGGVTVSESAIRKGLREVDWPGRFQLINNRSSSFKNLIILDGAHNEAAANRLVLTWREVFGVEKATLILGVLKDKDVTAVCRALLPIASACIVTPVRSERSSKAEELQAIIRELAPGLDCQVAGGISQAVGMAALRGEKILVAGSLFLVGEALGVFEGRSGSEMSLQ